MGASMLRAVVTQDGCVKANFDDNTVVVVHASGASFTAFVKEEESVRQLSEFATSGYAAKVAQVLVLRNTYVEEPYFCPLLASSAKMFKASYPIPVVHWPRSCEEAVQAHLVEHLADGSTALKCREEMATVVLSPHGLQLSVTFPLLTAHSSGPPPTYDFMWQSQLFSVQDCPRRWVAALQLVQRLRSDQLAAHLTTCSSAVSPSEDSQTQRVPEEVVDEEASVHTLGTTLSSTLPTSTQRFSPGWDHFDPGSWWRSYSLINYPDDSPPILEWTREASIRRTLDGEVQASLFAGASVVLSSQGGRYLHHRAASNCCNGAAAISDHMFTPQSVPSWTKCNLQDVVERALALQAAALRTEQSLKMTENERHSPGVFVTQVAGNVPMVIHTRGGGGRRRNMAMAPPGISAEVLEEVSVSDDATCAKFTAYKDRRIRVAFADRTLLEMDAEWEMVRVLLPNGETRLTRVGNPVGLERYVRPAVEFAAWAHLSPLERASKAERKAQVALTVQSQLARMQRHLRLSSPQGRVSPADELESFVNNTPTKQFAGLSDEKGLVTDGRASQMDTVAEMLRRNAAMMLKLTS